MADVSLSVPRIPEYLPLIRRTVAYIAERAGFDAYDTGEIEIAVDRSAGRAIAHQFSGASLASHQKLTIEVSVTADALEILLRDHDGRQRRSDSADGIDLDSYSAEYDMGGFDEFVVKDFMDEVEFVHRPRVGNELKMVRWLPGVRQDE